LPKSPRRTARDRGTGTDPLPRHPRRQPEQSTATSRAPQISRIRVSANRPSRLTSMATETLSTESRLTAERRGTGSSPGSRSTSLASPRIVVVHGATSARLCRGITTSRDRTTTGRRPIPAISHHHTSPRAGSALMRRLLPVATTSGRPTRLARRPGARRRRHNSHPPRWIGDERATREAPHQSARRRSPPSVRSARRREALRPRSCSVVCESCHHYATLASGASGGILIAMRTVTPGSR